MGELLPLPAESKIRRGNRDRSSYGIPIQVNFYTSSKGSMAQDGPCRFLPMAERLSVQARNFTTGRFRRNRGIEMLSRLVNSNGVTPKLESSNKRSKSPPTIAPAFWPIILRTGKL